MLWRNGKHPTDSVAVCVVMMDGPIDGIVVAWISSWNDIVLKLWVRNNILVSNIVDRHNIEIHRTIQ